ncbi:meiotic recombination protein DMC1 [Drechmeria coniospora]|uniref:Meiotic recombination protein DMC1 n=1 Tax=Drechmeria coniospora TaxID=98403 RepID=A0A151GM18_DRECN|nr:meiotic recombination protein DMC1 [Drechmeria coniospora]KYK58149.1 meiotic recombination protein DMC1 [Drechmeria coniospora]ODA83016.1 hypothetical protein RJ55_01525 [Drechmeria coniospora]
MAADAQPTPQVPPDGLLSPPPDLNRVPSSAASVLLPLPPPRSEPLLPGGRLEDSVRRRVEKELTNVSRRYVKRGGSPDRSDPLPGFTSFEEVCRELDSLVDVLWKTATPSLQIPLLLRLGSDFTQYVASFPPDPQFSFALLGKLDHCFASLLAGKDIDSGALLPGLQTGPQAGMSVTDMVRCRSLVEQTRLLMAEVMSHELSESGSGSGSGSEGEGNDEDDEEGMDADDAEADIYLGTARVYEKTIVQLGRRLGEPLVDENAPTNVLPSPTCPALA